MILRRSSITNDVLIACRACAHKLRLRIIKHTFQSLRQFNNESEYAQGTGSVRGPALFYLTLAAGHSGWARIRRLRSGSYLRMVLNPCVKCQLARVVFFHFSFHILSGSGPKRRGESSCYLNEMSEDPCTRRLPLFAQIEAYT